MRYSSMDYRPTLKARVWTVQVTAMVVALAWTLLGAPAMNAQAIDQPGANADESELKHPDGFADHSDLVANGSAKFVGTFAELTGGGLFEAGSIFSSGAVPIKNFTTEFTFSILPGTSPMADGITFCIQGNGPTALGGFGSALGYAGVPQSVAVKFDIFDNNGEGTDSTGVFRGGRLPGTAQAGGDILIGLRGTGIDLNSQHVFRARLSYHRRLLTLAITDTQTGASFRETVSVDIPSEVSSSRANVGFTGGTGGLSAIQDIRTWVFQGGEEDDEREEQHGE